MIILPSWLEGTLAVGKRFDGEGIPHSNNYTIDFPSELVYQRSQNYDWRKEKQEEDKFRQRRLEFLKKTIGFAPTFIRVHGFRLKGNVPQRLRNEVEDQWGRKDDPELSSDDAYDPLGEGELVYDYVKQGCYVYWCGNDWWCDTTGHITST